MEATELLPATFILQVLKPSPESKDTRLPTPPPASPCDYGCPRVNICRHREECCRAYRTYESSGVKYFEDWDRYVCKYIRPLNQKGTFHAAHQPRHV
jgi:hypothetical protein